MTARNFAAGWDRVGRQTQFYIATLRSTADAVVHYQVELLRLIAQMALGTGALILIGGTVVIVAFLMLSSGALVALQGYNALASNGVDALVGFVAAFVDRPPGWAVDRHRRSGGHHRLRGDGTTGRHAHQ